MLAPRPNSGSVASTPSNWYLISPARPPRKWSSPPCETTPALVAMAWRRLSTGSSRSFSAEMVCRVVEDLVSMRFSARTSISSRVFTVLDSPKVKLTVVVAPALTWTPVCICLSWPIACTRTVYVPTGTPVSTKFPFSSVGAPCLVPRMMTLANATGSLPRSSTRPTMRPVAAAGADDGISGFCCATAGAASARAKAIHATPWRAGRELMRPPRGKYPTSRLGYGKCQARASARRLVAQPVARPLASKFGGQSGTAAGESGSVREEELGTQTRHRGLTRIEVPRPAIANYQRVAPACQGSLFLCRCTSRSRWLRRQRRHR